MPKLTFDPKEHIYTLDGKKIPSVTQVLDRNNMFYFPDGTRLELAKVRGTYTHKATVFADRGTLDPRSLDKEHVEPRVKAWEQFKRETGFVILETETPIFSGIFGFAGTPDRIGILFGEKCVIDIKTSDTYCKAYDLQTAGYEIAYNEHQKAKADQVRKRYALLLKSNGSYSLIPCKEKTDRTAFLSCLNVARYKDKNKIR